MPRPASFDYSAGVDSSRMSVVSREMPIHYPGLGVGGVVNTALRGRGLDSEWLRDSSLGHQLDRGGWVVEPISDGSIALFEVVLVSHETRD